MGFYYKNFFVSIIACSIAFGGFLSSVYSFESIKTAAKAAKANQTVSASEKQYDERDVVRAREMMVAVQQNILAEEKIRIAVAQQNLDRKVQEFQQKVAAQKNTVQVSRVASNTAPVVKKTPIAVTSPVSQIAQKSFSLSSAASVIPLIQISQPSISAPLSDIPSLTAPVAPTTPIAPIASVTLPQITPVTIPTIPVTPIAPVAPVAPVPTPTTTPVVSPPAPTAPAAPRTTVS